MVRRRGLRRTRDAYFEIVIVEPRDGHTDRLLAPRLHGDVVGRSAFDVEKKGDVIAGLVGVVFFVDGVGGLIAEPAHI